MYKVEMDIDEFDFPNIFDFELTQESIDNGERASCWYCPIALSFKDSDAKEQFNLVDLETIEIGDFLVFNGTSIREPNDFDETWKTFYIATLSEKVKEWADRFDTTGEGIPRKLRFEADTCTATQGGFSLLVKGVLFFVD